MNERMLNPFYPPRVAEVLRVTCEAVSLNLSAQ
jgi:hypothetical protein